MKITIVYASATGRTKRMAEAAADGARGAGAQVSLLPAAEAQPEALGDVDAVMLGTGVHMGGMESEMSGFLERSAPLWMQGGLVGKLGAVFVSAGAGGRGGAELTQLAMLATLAEHGMLLVSMSSKLPGFAGGGSHWGPVAWTNPRAGEPGPTEKHLEAARSHGRHVAECTARWLRGVED